MVRAGGRAAEARYRQIFRRALPALPAAVEGVVAAEGWRRGVKRQEFLGGETTSGATRRQVFEELRVDAVEYNRQLRWLKKGFTSGQKVPSSQSELDGDGESGLEVDKQAGFLDSSAAATPARTDTEAGWKRR
jgi:hypothetical protein